MYWGNFYYFNTLIFLRTQYVLVYTVLVHMIKTILIWDLMNIWISYDIFLYFKYWSNGGISNCLIKGWVFELLFDIFLHLKYWYVDDDVLSNTWHYPIKI